MVENISQKTKQTCSFIRDFRLSSRFTLILAVFFSFLSKKVRLMIYTWFWGWVVMPGYTKLIWRTRSANILLFQIFRYTLNLLNNFDSVQKLFFHTFWNRKLFIWAFSQIYNFQWWEENKTRLKTVWGQGSFNVDISLKTKSCT